MFIIRNPIPEREKKMTANLTLRQQRILDVLNEKDSVSVNDLANQFEVTPTTIRRELTSLSEQDLIVRRHGLACLRQQPIKGPSSFALRQALHQEEKILIARRALEYLSPEDSSIILDSGSTVCTMAEQLKSTGLGKLLRITVISNSLPVAVCSPGYQNLLCGGNIHEESQSLIGAEAEAYFDTIIADKAFIGANGIFAMEGPSATDKFQLSIKKKIISRAAKNYILLDSHKFKAAGLSKVCDFKDVYAVITVRTDENTEIIERLSASGIFIDCANEPRQEK